jgi:ABC-2 type transport system ATP-binding protein
MRAAAARAVVNAGGELHHLSVEEPSLDAIYNRYFQKIAENVEEQRDAA